MQWRRNLRWHMPSRRLRNERWQVRSSQSPGMSSVQSMRSPVPRKCNTSYRVVLGNSTARLYSNQNQPIFQKPLWLFHIPQDSFSRHSESVYLTGHLESAIREFPLIFPMSDATIRRWPQVFEFKKLFLSRLTIAWHRFADSGYSSLGCAS